jgi:hypothetical protein
MQHALHPLGFCECGRPIEFKNAVGAGSHREISCVCRRRHDVELGGTGWTVVAQLTPERSVPLAGFSNELRQAADSERFWFKYPLRGAVPLPVHILFSRSAKRAEVKGADLKVFAVDGVRIPTEARRQWIAWWHARRAASRERGPSLVVPSRIGRLPAALPLRRAAVLPTR